MTKEELSEMRKQAIKSLNDVGAILGLDEMYVDELEKENTDLKCECRRCVYSDTPCVLSDYGKDKNGICDHFKDVFDENIELEEKLEQAEKVKVVEHFEAYGQCRDSRRIAELEAQIEKMKNWCNCKNYSQCLIELAEQGKGMKPSECCVNCKKWELEDYRTRLERKNKKK